MHNVFFVYHARQVGPLYFKSPRKIQIFGICCGSNRKQHNYLIDEDDSIGTNGAVPTQLFRCLTTISIHTTYMRYSAIFTVIIVWVKIKTTMLLDI